MAVIAAIQFVSFLIGFSPGYDLVWIINKGGTVVGGNFGIRISGLYLEPSQLAIIQAPALFIAFYTLVLRKRDYYKPYMAIVIIITYLLSFSSVGYIGILVAVILLMINYGLVRYIVIFVPLAAIIFYLLYTNVEDFRTRYDDTISTFDSGEFKIGKTHGSSIVLYDNYIVALTNFKKNFIVGTGFGSHKIAYGKYSITKHLRNQKFKGNEADANSLLLRIMSETGLFGLIITFYFLIKNYKKREDNENEEYDVYWLISNALLIVMLLFLFRQGHYFINGFPFFVLLYYFNRKAYETKLEESKLQKIQVTPIPSIG